MLVTVVYNEVSGIIRMKIFLAQIYCWLNLFIMKYKVSYQWKYFWRKFIACYLRLWWSIGYHRNENYFDANLLLVTFVDHEVWAIIGMKMFLAEIYSFLLLFIMKYKLSSEWKSFWQKFIACYFCLSESVSCHQNENIFGSNLLLVRFVYNEV